MNATFNIGVLGKQPLGRVGVGQLHLHKSGGLPGNLPDATQYDRLAVDKVIRDNQVLSPFQKLHRCMGSDEPGSPCDQNGHTSLSYSISNSSE